MELPSAGWVISIWVVSGMLQAQKCLPEHYPKQNIMQYLQALIPSLHMSASFDAYIGIEIHQAGEIRSSAEEPRLSRWD